MKWLKRWICFFRKHRWPFEKPVHVSHLDHLKMLTSEEFPCARCGLVWKDRWR